MEEEKVVETDRIKVLEDKINMLMDVIKEIDTGERRNEFHEKWAPRIAEIEGDQKTVYGEGWNEEDGLWKFHEEHQGDESYDEDASMNAYFDSVKERFNKLRSQATTPEEKEIVSEAEDQAKESTSKEEAKEIVTTAEEEVKEAKEEKSADQPPDEEEVKEALKHRDF